MQKYQVGNKQVKLQVFTSRTESDIAMIFIHGGPGSGAWPLIMQPAIQKLSQEYRCLFFDQRGCGLSLYPLEKGITFEQQMEDIRCIIQDCKERYKIRKLIVFGDSFGGYLSLMCLEQYQDLFDGMILSSPLLLLGEIEECVLFQYVKEYLLELSDPKLHKLVSVLINEDASTFFKNRHLRQMIYENKHISMQIQYIVAISDWLFQKPCAEALHRTTVPTLIMKGQDDVVTSEERILDILVRLQNPFVVYESFPDCGRVIYEDQPDEFVKRVNRFIKEEFPCG